MDTCVFCNKSLADREPTVVLGQKGCDGIEKASISRESELRTVAGQTVHVKCRRDYINPLIIKNYRKRTAEKVDDADRHSLRSSGLFDYKTNCIFCGCPDPYDGKRSDFRVIKARTLDFKDSILQACERYQNDWVNVVKPRVLFVSDLPAADVVYHKQCIVNFMTGKQIPKKIVGRQTDAPIKCKYPKLSGRPKNELKYEAFLQVARYLEENDDEQITINDLIDHMGSFLAEEDCEPHSFPFMKKELLNHFGDKIIIAEVKESKGKMFMSQGVSKGDIISSGEAALISLYKGNPCHRINMLRYEKFCVKAATSSTQVHPATLPPTSASVKYHSLRVYHQIQVWLGNEMNPVDWGWKVSSGKLLPVMTDLQPAAQKFLEVIRCGCTAGCTTQRCSCRKHGMTCSTACSECRGVCANAPKDIDSEPEDDC